VRACAAGALLLLLVNLGLPAPAAGASVVDTIANSGGRYVWAAATLQAADCSGLVSVAQSLAMGEEPHRIGDTHTMLAGQWRGAIRGASPSDVFVVGVNGGHMTASINGVGIEASTPGAPYRIGSSASSPWGPQYQQFHIDPGLLVAL
jgi:hypothetical protein